ncbi:MAG: ABC transporter permease [Geminicoccaceae bacterium]
MKRSAADNAGLAVMVAIAAFSLLALVGPSLVVIGISFTERQYISFPPVGFTLEWYAAIFENQQLIDAAKTSLVLAASVTATCLALGMPAAFSITRGRYGGRQTLSAFLLAPQMMPGMVIGIAMLFFGSFFAFRQSLLMMILGLTVFCLPFVVRMLMARLAVIDPALEEASLNLGASRSQTLKRVTLPQLLPGTLAAAAFTFIEAFDNLTVVLFTASPRTRPLSVELYQLVQFDSSPLVAAISALEIGLAFLIVLVLSRTVGLSRLGD